MEKNKHSTKKPGVPDDAVNERRELSGNPFPLGVYPVFDDDLPRDGTFENFSAPDLRDHHPYPRGLD